MLVRASVPTTYEIARYRREDEQLGCSRVFCRECKSWVRWIDDCKTKLRRTDKAASIYADPDPDHWPTLLERSSTMRVYLCRCEWFLCRGVTYLSDIDEFDGWICGRHPQGLPFVRMTDVPERLRPFVEQLVLPLGSAAAEAPLDLGLIEGISPEEMTQVEDLLVRRVEVDDERIPDAIATLGLKSAALALRGAMGPERAAGVRVLAAYTLAQLLGDPVGLPAIVEISKTGAPRDRKKAVAVLRFFRGADATFALLAALDDKDRDVSAVAFDVLLDVLGLAAWATNLGQPLGIMRLRTGAELETVRHLAAEDFRTAISVLREGRTTGDAGLDRQLSCTDAERDAIIEALAAQDRALFARTAPLIEAAG